MHLLAAQPGFISDGGGAVDLAQTPGDIVILSAADTELACLAAARSRLGESFPSVRLANVLHLTHNLSVDLYVDSVVQAPAWSSCACSAGPADWPYGVEQLCEACARHDVALALLPGDDQPDAELKGLSNVPSDAYHRLWQYCVHGGPGNAGGLLAYAASLVGHDADWRERCRCCAPGSTGRAAIGRASIACAPNVRRGAPSRRSFSTAPTIRPPTSRPSTP